MSKFVFEIAAGPIEFDKKKARKLAIDAKEFGNETRFINSYKNIAAKPNVAFREDLRRPDVGPDGAGEFVMVRKS